MCGAEETLKAEFPSWHLLAAFDVFHLGGGTSDSDKYSVEKSLERLACAFGVNLADLKQQYVAILPMAQAMKKKTGQDNRTVWAQVLLRVQDRRLKEKYPQDALYRVTRARNIDVYFTLM